MQAEENKSFETKLATALQSADAKFNEAVRNKKRHAELIVKQSQILKSAVDDFKVESAHSSGHSSALMTKHLTQGAKWPLVNETATEREDVARADKQSTIDAVNYVDSVKHLLNTARAVPATANNPAIPNAQVQLTFCAFKFSAHFLLGNRRQIQLRAGEGLWSSASRRDRVASHARISTYCREVAQTVRRGVGGAFALPISADSDIENRALHQMLTAQRPATSANSARAILTR